jgi:hypothetical protein
MNSKWTKREGQLKYWLIDKQLSYEEVGRKFGCSGSNIRKVCKRLGFDLKPRRVINSSEHFNKGKDIKYCLNCGNEYPYESKKRKYCSKYCAGKHKSKLTIQNWLDGTVSGHNSWGGLREPIRNFILEKAGYKCCKCGWGEVNPTTGKVPVQVDHIDGNYLNCSLDNLQVLCPNCHSLTSTFGSLNRGNGRPKYRSSYKKIT